MPRKSFFKDCSWGYQIHPMIHWSFKVLMFASILGLLVIYEFDCWDSSSFHNDFVAIKLNNAHQYLTHTHESVDQFSASSQSRLSFQENLTQTSEPMPLISTRKQGDVSDSSSEEALSLEWISVDVEGNFTSNLLSAWVGSSVEPCSDSQTVGITIPELDGHDYIELSTGKIHEFVFQAVDDVGKPHCIGGDYFETDISGELWKSRPPVKDLGNGTYTFSLQVHPDFSGDYNLTIILLFRHFEGLKNSPQRFVIDKVLRTIPIKFIKSSAQLSAIRQCLKSDFTRDIWSGRWTRHAKNDSCGISNDGRYRCQEPDFPCQQPWCDGSLGSLESNGWTYSTHCSFKLFSGEAAWNCLNNRWLFFWGDSNHCDTIRNIFKFILNLDFKDVPRHFDMNITNPDNPMQTVRITSIFNGNSNVGGNYQGLSSLYNETYRELLKSYFSQEIVPDTVIINSGLHDGVFWPTLRRFTRGAEDAAAFWADVIDGVRQKALVSPEIIFRSTVATAGHARSMAFNPSKMEAFNGVLLDKLRQFGLVSKVIDDFDLTYPWHFDNRCSDGVHYGRAPAKLQWRDGQIGHQYFVDLMLCHVLLNALCQQ
ncbi:SNARE associated Golgi protein family [Heracleum sosnowskyi]|uniref:SNARE associated Golgi protein family n=1 Tax=Heracleum sosnowskyi TaxID=360622 RepID=A0AAD8J3Q3_9APIA|nr:SNARE associated Golgi protein family [Heracleum sosnowskyi]